MLAKVPAQQDSAKLDLLHKAALAPARRPVRPPAARPGLDVCEGNRPSGHLEDRPVLDEQ